MLPATVNKSQVAWSRVLHPSSDDPARRRLLLLAMIVERLDRGLGSGAAIDDDAGLSEEYDQWLERRGLLKEPGSVGELRLALSTDPRNRRGQRIWRAGEGFLYPEPAFVPVLQGTAGREWLREELRGRLGESPGPREEAPVWLSPIWKAITGGDALFTEEGLSAAGLSDDVQGRLPGLLQSLERRGLVDTLGEGRYRRRVGDLELGEKILARLARPDYSDLTTRGARAQTEAIFRNRVLANFRSYCAFCGLGLPVLLEAAHIVPREEEPARALDPTLGLALCATHRAAFDRHLVGVDEGRVFLRAGLEGNGRAKPLWSIQNARMREPRCAVDRDALRQHAGRVRE